MGLKISGLQLSNGLRVVVVEDPRAAEIQVTMRYRVGSADDPPTRAGMEHRRGAQFFRRPNAACTALLFAQPWRLGVILWSPSFVCAVSQSGDFEFRRRPRSITSAFA